LRVAASRSARELIGGRADDGGSNALTGLALSVGITERRGVTFQVLVDILELIAQKGVADKLLALVRSRPGVLLGSGQGTVSATIASIIVACRCHVTGSAGACLDGVIASSSCGVTLSRRTAGLRTAGHNADRRALSAHAALSGLTLVGKVARSKIGLVGYDASTGCGVTLGSSASIVGGADLEVGSVTFSTVANS